MSSAAKFVSRLVNRINVSAIHTLIALSREAATTCGRDILETDVWLIFGILGFMMETYIRKCGLLVEEAINQRAGLA